MYLSNISEGKGSPRAKLHYIFNVPMNYSIILQSPTKTKELPNPPLEKTKELRITTAGWKYSLTASGTLLDWDATGWNCFYGCPFLLLRRRSLLARARRTIFTTHAISRFVRAVAWYVGNRMGSNKENARGPPLPPSPSPSRKMCEGI